MLLEHVFFVIQVARVALHSGKYMQGVGVLSGEVLLFGGLKRWIPLLLPPSKNWQTYLQRVQGIQGTNQEERHKI